MRFKSCFIFLVTVCSGKPFAEDRPCDLPQIENGNLAQYYYSFKSYYFPMHKGKKLSYSCLVGYTTESGTQDGRITCTAKGWSPVPQCYRKCTRPLLENGTFYGTEMDFKIHEKLQYKCNPGYHTPSGAAEDTVQCQPQGWSFQPSCTQELGAAASGDPTASPPAAPAPVAPPARKLIYPAGKNPKRAAGGSLPQLTLCVFFPGISCSALRGVAHGGFHPVKQIYEEGDVVHFFCDRSYSVTGFDLIQCYNFGWFPDPPVCEDVKSKCPPPPVPGGQISRARASYHNGDTVHVQCTSGGRGSEELQCEGGKWTSPSPCTGAVEMLGSGTPPPEADAEIKASQTHPSEDKSSFNCLPVCPIAELQDCAPPPEVKNGAVVGPLLARYTDGSWVDYGCQHLHLLQGPSTVYCHRGSWTQHPACLEPCTLNVTDMDSNNITLKWRKEESIFLHGDLIEFECKQGYEFVQTDIPSPGRTQCDRGRLKYPKCAIQAAAEKCGSPPSVANGALALPVLPQYDSGSSVQYICSDYHFLQGSERIYCSEGQWTSPPACIEPCILSKTEMEKNNLLLQAFYADQVYFYHGDYVGFYCKQNHFGAESGTTLFQVQCKRGQLAYPRCVER
ncbi:F13B factor, partial [Thryothorus ludovicianus]|nr:F13B factor [Thryothorus ludovicianus]